VSKRSRAATQFRQAAGLTPPPVQVEVEETVFSSARSAQLQAAERDLLSFLRKWEREHGALVATDPDRLTPAEFSRVHDMFEDFTVWADKCDAPKPRRPRGRAGPRQPLGAGNLSVRVLSVSPPEPEPAPKPEPREYWAPGLYVVKATPERRLLPSIDSPVAHREYRRESDE